MIYPDTAAQEHTEHCSQAAAKIGVVIIAIIVSFFKYRCFSESDANAFYGDKSQS